MAPSSDIVYIENAEIIFRNFEGRPGKFNKPGVRNFCVFLDPETAVQMANDDWNVKWLEPREDDDPEAERRPFLPIELRYDVGRPPLVKMITTRGPTNLTEETVEQLDFVDIVYVDIGFRGSHWDVNGKTGVKAYLQSIYVTIEEDYLARKYAEMENQQ
jgi:hypothetical protein